MLRVEEDKRISMVELINHDYVQQNLKEETIISENSLVQSFASSQSYMSRNKVITKTSMSPEVSNNMVSTKGQVQEKIKENDFTKEVDEQNQRINVYLKVEEVD